MKNKKILYTLFILFSIFICISLSPTKAHAVTYKPGDIFITKSTSSAGIAGHTGIVIGKNTILHTSGWKSEPYPKIINIKKAKGSKTWWFKRYPETKVIRPNSASLGEKAASNAKKYFKDKKIPYSITKTKMTSRKATYCSHLIWYSYYKSNKSFKTYDASSGVFVWKTPKIIKPYDFIDKLNLDHNKFKFVDNKW